MDRNIADLIVDELDPENTQAIIPTNVEHIGRSLKDEDFSIEKAQHTSVGPLIRVGIHPDFYDKFSSKETTHTWEDVVREAGIYAREEGIKSYMNKKHGLRLNYMKGFKLEEFVKEKLDVTKKKLINELARYKILNPELVDLAFKRNGVLVGISDFNQLIEKLFGGPVTVAKTNGFVESLYAPQKINIQYISGVVLLGQDDRAYLQKVVSKLS